MAIDFSFLRDQESQAAPSAPPTSSGIDFSHLRDPVTKDGRYRVIDGDTVGVLDRSGNVAEYIRLGPDTDAPEKGRESAALSKQALTDALDSGEFELERLGEIADGRTLGRFVSRDGRDLQSELVRRGYMRGTHGQYQNENDAFEAAFQSNSLEPDLQAALDNPDQPFRLAGKPQQWGETGDFRRGVVMGFNQAQAAAGGVAMIAGQTLGSEGLENYGRDVVQRNLAEAAETAPRVQDWRSAMKSPGDFIDFAQGALGQAAPSMATAIFTGGAGGIAARLAVQKAVQGATKEALKLAAKRGSMAGVAASSIGQEAGLIQADLDEAGIRSPATALAFGTLAGLLDALPQERIIAKLFAGVDPKLAKNFILNVAREAGIQSVLEGGTEAMQSLIEQAAVAFHDPSVKLFSHEAIDEYITSALAGAIAGSVPGAASGAFAPRRAEGTEENAAGEQTPADEFLAERQRREAAGETVEDITLETATPWEDVFADVEDVVLETPDGTDRYEAPANEGIEVEELAADDLDFGFGMPGAERVVLESPPEDVEPDALEFIEEARDKVVQPEYDPRIEDLVFPDRELEEAIAEPVSTRGIYVRERPAPTSTLPAVSTAGIEVEEGAVDPGDLGLQSEAGQQVSDIVHSNIDRAPSTISKKLSALPEDVRTAGVEELKAATGTASLAAAIRKLKEGRQTPAAAPAAANVPTVEELQGGETSAFDSAEVEYDGVTEEAVNERVTGLPTDLDPIEFVGSEESFGTPPSDQFQEMQARDRAAQAQRETGGYRASSPIYIGEGSGSSLKQARAVRKPKPYQTKKDATRRARQISGVSPTLQVAVVKVSNGKGWFVRVQRPDNEERVYHPSRKERVLRTIWLQDMLKASNEAVKKHDSYDNNSYEFNRRIFTLYRNGRRKRVDLSVLSRFGKSALDQHTRAYGKNNTHLDFLGLMHALQYYVDMGWTFAPDVSKMRKREREKLIRRYTEGLRAKLRAMENGDGPFRDRPATKEQFDRVEANIRALSTDSAALQRLANMEAERGLRQANLRVYRGDDGVRGVQVGEAEQAGIESTRPAEESDQIAPNDWKAVTAGQLIRRYGFEHPLMDQIGDLASMARTLVKLFTKGTDLLKALSVKQEGKFRRVDAVFDAERALDVSGVTGAHRKMTETERKWRSRLRTPLTTKQELEYAREQRANALFLQNATKKYERMQAIWAHLRAGRTPKTLMKRLQDEAVSLVSELNEIADKRDFMIWQGARHELQREERGKPPADYPSRGSVQDLPAHETPLPNDALDEMVEARNERREASHQERLRALGKMTEETEQETEADQQYNRTGIGILPTEASEHRRVAAANREEAAAAVADLAQNRRERELLTGIREKPFRASVVRVKNNKQAITDILSFVRTKLGLRDKFVVFDANNLDAAPAWAAAEIRQTPGLSGRIHFVKEKVGEGDNAFDTLTHYIYIRDGAGLSVLLHELGHAIHRTYWEALSPSMQKDLVEAWMKEGVEPSFTEWMANQLVAWATTAADSNLDAARQRRTPRNGVEAFFKRVADALRDLWQYAKRLYRLDSTYQEFVESVAAIQFDSEPTPVFRDGSLIARQLRRAQAYGYAPAETSMDKRLRNPEYRPALFVPTDQQGLWSKFGDRARFLPKKDLTAGLDQHAKNVISEAAESAGLEARGSSEGNKARKALYNMLKDATRFVYFAPHSAAASGKNSFPVELAKRLGVPSIIVVDPATGAFAAWSRSNNALIPFRATALTGRVASFAVAKGPGVERAITQLFNATYPDKSTEVGPAKGKEERAAAEGEPETPRERRDRLIREAGKAPEQTKQGTRVLRGVRRIISGGQTGGDMGGLLAGRELGLETGGTAPRGWKTERGRNPGLAGFGVKQSSSDNYVTRTIQNVNDADATVAFLWGRSVGTGKTIGYAQTGRWQYGDNKTKLDGHKPVLVISTRDPAAAAKQIRDFVDTVKPGTLNIAGHREGSQPGLEQFVKQALVSGLNEKTPETQGRVERSGSFFRSGASTIAFNSRTPDFAYLSNFSSHPITDKNGTVWRTAEHAYQAMKTTVAKEREHVRSAATPAEAKNRGRRVTVQEGWNDKKRDLMKRILRMKFEQHPGIRQKLIETGSAKLVHKAPWDKYWGDGRDGAGANVMGEVLMELRQEFAATMDMEDPAWGDLGAPDAQSDFTPPGPAIMSVVEAARKKLPSGYGKGRWSGPLQALSTAGRGSLWVWDHMFATLDGRMRRMARALEKSGNIDKAENSALWKIADGFRVLAGKNGEETLYRARYSMITKLSQRAREVFDGLSEEQRTELHQAMRFGKQPSDPEVAARVPKLRRLFDEMHSYMLRAGLPVEKIKNYYPVMFSQSKMLERGAEDHFISLLTDPSLGKDAYTYADARALYNRIADGVSEVYLQQNMPMMTTSPADQTHRRHRRLYNKIQDREAMEEFLETDPQLIVEQYIRKAVNAAEFNRRFGNPVTRDQRTGKFPEKWNPSEGIELLLGEAQREGLSAPQMREVEGMLDAYLGRVGTNMPAAMRRFLGGIMLYQNFRLLLFATLASIQDIVGPSIRANNTKYLWQTLSESLRGEYIGSGKDPYRIGRALGVVNDTMNDHILSEALDNHYTSPFVQKWNERFFKFTLLKQWTNFTRAAAVNVGVQALDDYAQLASGRWPKAAHARAWLQELGLKPQDVLQWSDNGRRDIEGRLIYGESDLTWEAKDGGYLREGVTDAELANAEMISKVLRRFVDESILRPDAAQRPAWASHPMLMPFWHLKSFMYAFSMTILPRISHNLNGTDITSVQMQGIATALLLLPVAALGLEIRELIQYGTEESFYDRMSTPEYALHLLSRAGFLGLSQLAYDFGEAEDRGRIGMISAVGGPALDQLQQAITQPASRTLTKAIPGVSQLPWAREYLHNMAADD